LPFDTIVERKVIGVEAGEKGTVVMGELPNRVLPETRPRENEVDEVSATTESGRTLDAMALDSWKNGDLVRAMELFDEAVKADPNDALIRANYGRMLTKMGAFDKAQPQLLRAAELEPDDPTAWLDLQTLYEREFLVEQADDAANRAEALAGGRRIVQDEFGDWMLEGDRTGP
jgi:predicted Zn-dependent protease